MNCRRLRLFFVSLLTLVGPGLHATDRMPGADDKWRHFQSEHFELYSRNPERESRRFLRNLEMANAVFYGTFELKPVRSVPLTVFFFAKNRVFDAYRPEAFKAMDTLAAYYHESVDRGMIAMAPIPTYEDAQAVAFGGYAYHLIRLSGDRFPLWYGYGMASVFESMLVGTENVELGKPDPRRLRRLQSAYLMPVEALLAADPDSDSFRANLDNGLFKDESWALVHYLYFGRHELARAKVTDYMGYVVGNSGEFDAVEAKRIFEGKLGIPYEKMAADLARYAKIGSYNTVKRARPALAADSSYAMRDVPMEEIDLRLAELQFRVRRSAAAKVRMMDAVDRGVDAARLQEALGADALKDGDLEGAMRQWEGAMAAGSVNSSVLYEICQFEGWQLFEDFDTYFRLPEDTAAKLRQRLIQLIAQAPLRAGNYELLAWVEATAKEPQTANVELVEKNLARLPDKSRAMLAFAILKIRQQDNTGALGVLDEIDRTAPGDWVRRVAEHTRAALEGRPVNPEKLPSAPAAGRRLRSTSFRPRPIP